MMNGLNNVLLTISWQIKCLPFLNKMHEGALLPQSTPHIMYSRVHLLDALITPKMRTNLVLTHFYIGDLLGSLKGN